MPAFFSITLGTVRKKMAGTARPTFQRLAPVHDDYAIFQNNGRFAKRGCVLQRVAMNRNQVG